MDKEQKKQQQIPSIKKDNKCFQYTVTVALNHEKIGGHPERITKIKPFTKIIGKEKNDRSEKDWKKFENNFLMIALNVLYAKNENNIPCLRFKT